MGGGNTFPFLKQIVSPNLPSAWQSLRLWRAPESTQAPCGSAGNADQKSPYRHSTNTTLSVHPHLQSMQGPAGYFCTSKTQWLRSHADQVTHGDSSTCMSQCSNRGFKLIAKACSAGDGWDGCTSAVIASCLQALGKSTSHKQGYGLCPGTAGETPDRTQEKLQEHKITDWLMPQEAHTAPRCCRASRATLHTACLELWSQNPRMVWIGRINLKDNLVPNPLPWAENLPLHKVAPSPI